MTYTPGTYQCDGCDDPVSEREMVTLKVGAAAESDWHSGFIAHYHDSCFETVREALYDVVEEQRSEVSRLERIPTATNGDIFALRHQMAVRRRAASALTDELLDLMSCVSPTYRIHAEYSLRDRGITTVAELRALSDAEMRRLKGFGPMSVRRVREALAEPQEA